MSNPTERYWLEGVVESSVGSVPRLRAELTFRDRIDAFKARWMINRTRHFIPPGLYAFGNPTSDSPVLATANYKLTVDALRREVGDHNLWVLVLDTKGINVWCAAGKGTFGTDELVNRIEELQLSQLVNHREIVLPQLGAPGVAAHEIKKRTDFSVRYGPIRASDLPRFFDNGSVVTKDMRQVRFPFGRRLVLIPVELLSALKYGILAALCFLIAGGLTADGYSTTAAVSTGSHAALYIGAGITAGTVLVPALLPWLPGRSFSVKGLAACVLVLLLLISIWPGFMLYGANRLTIVGCLLISLAIGSFTGMNFTGSSTYTSLSGVRREMRQTVPLQFAAALLGVIAWIIGRFWSF